MSTRYILHILTLPLLILWLGSCEKDDDGRDYSNSRTVVMYIAADNNLNNEASSKFDIVLQSWKPQYGQLVFFIDKLSKSPLLLKAKVVKGENVTDTLKTYTLQNSASAELLSEVLSDVKRFAPAKSYGMIFFSHATGWLPKGGYQNPSMVNPGQRTNAESESRSIGVDNGEEMELVDFAAAIDDGFFEFILFEACLMSGVEVAYELRNKSHYIVASSAEIVRPGFYLLYGQFLPYLYKEQADLKRVAELYYNHTLSLSDDFRSSTISVVDCSQMETLSAVCKQIIGSSVVDVELSAIQCFDRYDTKLTFDLADYIHQLASSQQKMAFDQAMLKCVTYRANTPKFMPNLGGYTIKSHSGLTTYIPQMRFVELNTLYSNLAWSRAVRVEE